jgi:chromosome segregation ATPase
LQPTDATNKDGEIAALKQLIEELKQDKEDLKKDKEDLKQEAIKWQQLLLEEKNKVKLLEAATSKTEGEVIEFEEVADSKEEVREAVPATPKGFINKLKWLFGSGNRYYDAEE